MTSAQVDETSLKATTNSPSQDYTHPDDHNLRTCELNNVFFFLDNNDETTGKSTSIDVFSREISNQEDGATSASFVTGDNSNLQEKTATVVNGPNEISQKEWEMGKRPEEEAGETSSQQPSTQSKSKKEKKKKASEGTGSAKIKEEKGGTSSLEGTSSICLCVSVLFLIVRRLFSATKVTCQFAIAYFYAGCPEGAYRV